MGKQPQFRYTVAGFVAPFRGKVRIKLALRTHLGILAAFLFATPGVQATVIEVTGAFLEIAPPASVEWDALESNDNIFIFPEQTDYALPADVTVDFSTAGLYDSTEDRTPATLSAGTLVDVHFVHFDPVGTTNVIQSGSVTFDRPVFGLILWAPTLHETDPTLGQPGILYPSEGWPVRGLENNADIVQLSTDRRTVTVHRFQTNFPGEQMRIITIPSPSGYELGVAALLLTALGWMRCRTRLRKAKRRSSAAMPQ